MALQSDLFEGYFRHIVSIAVVVLGSHEIKLIEVFMFAKHPKCV